MLYLATLCPSFTDELRAHRRRPGAVRHQPGDDETLRAGRVGELRLLRLPFALVLGLKLYLITTYEGMPVAWCLVDPELGEREVATELFGHARDTGALRDAMIVLTDKGLNGTELERFCANELHILLARPDRKDTKRRKLAGVRQWIETVYDTLKDQLNLERHGGRTPTGVIVRVAQRLLALTATIWHNWKTDAPTKRPLTAYDH